MKISKILVTIALLGISSGAVADSMKESFTAPGVSETRRDILRLRLDSLRDGKRLVAGDKVNERMRAASERYFEAQFQSALLELRCGEKSSLSCEATARELARYRTQSSFKRINGMGEFELGLSLSALEVRISQR